MTKEELAKAIRALKVFQSGLKLSIPSDVRTVARLDMKPLVKQGLRPHQGNLPAGVREFLRPWVSVKHPDGIVTKLDPNRKQDTIRRNLLIAAGGKGLGRMLRSEPARSAMADLVSEVRAAVEDAWQRAEYGSLRRKARKTLETREKNDRKKAVAESVGRIRRELLGPAYVLSEEEIVSLYRDCQVRRVLES